MVSDKRFTGILELVQLYKQNLLENVLTFTIIYQNYTLALYIGFTLEPGGPCTKSMEVSESRMERVNYEFQSQNRLKLFIVLTIIIEEKRLEESEN